MSAESDAAWDAGGPVVRGGSEGHGTNEAQSGTSGAS